MVECNIETDRDWSPRRMRLLGTVHSRPRDIDSRFPRVITKAFLSLSGESFSFLRSPGDDNAIARLSGGLSIYGIVTRGARRKTPYPDFTSIVLRQIL